MATMRKQEEDRISRDLLEVLYTTRPAVAQNATEAATNRGLYLNCCDEVYPGIYIGDCYCAKNKPYLKQLGITHVVNTAEGKLLGMVDTDADYYKHSGIKYLGLPLMDLPVTDISCHFYEVSDFIHDALRSGGKVLVHCLMGLSRSSTCVLAYLMIKEGMSAADALRRVRRFREVRPNNGFLQQLAELDMKLKRSSYSISVIDEDRPKRIRNTVSLPVWLSTSRIRKPFIPLESTNTERNPTWLPTGRCLSFRPSLNVYKIHSYS